MKVSVLGADEAGDFEVLCAGGESVRVTLETGAAGAVFEAVAMQPDEGRPTRWGVVAREGWDSGQLSLTAALESLAERVAVQRRWLQAGIADKPVLVDGSLDEDDFDDGLDEPTLAGVPLLDDVALDLALRTINEEEDAAQMDARLVDLAMLDAASLAVSVEPGPLAAVGRPGLADAKVREAGDALDEIEGRMKRVFDAGGDGES